MCTLQDASWLILSVEYLNFNAYFLWDFATNVCRKFQSFKINQDSVFKSNRPAWQFRKKSLFLFIWPMPNIPLCRESKILSPTDFSVASVPRNKFVAISHDVDISSLYCFHFQFKVIFICISSNYHHSHCKGPVTSPFPGIDSNTPSLPSYLPSSFNSVWPLPLVFIFREDEAESILLAVYLRILLISFLGSIHRETRLLWMNNFV